MHTTELPPHEHSAPHEDKSPIVIPPADRELEEMIDFSKFLSTAGTEALLLGPDGQQVELPSGVFKVLVKVTEAMAKNQAISLAPVDQKLTTQQAADFLGISRPTLIKMLENGTIAYEKLPESRHRRILLSDLLDYQRQHRQKQQAILDFLVEDAEEAGLFDTKGGQ